MQANCRFRRRYFEGRRTAGRGTTQALQVNPESDRAKIQEARLARLRAQCNMQRG
jgi:hypothetical protein